MYLHIYIYNARARSLSLSLSLCVCVSRALDCAVKTYREGGLPVFFRGIQFSLVRAGALDGLGCRV